MRMKKLLLLLTFACIAVWSHGQIIYGVSWVNWATEPNYAETHYENPKVTVYKAPAAWSPVTSVASFDATWDVLGSSNLVANPTNIAGGDLFDLNGDATFGAAWKAVHDGSNLYILLKYSDKNGVTDAGTMTFEIMAQPTSPVRHEPTFNAAKDSTAEKTLSGASEVVRYQNMAYARNVALGGGKALFKDGLVTEYAASAGMVKNAWQNFVVGNWGPNEVGLEALLDADHFWNKTDGVIRAVVVMSFDGALSYPEDPANLASSRKAIKVGETFAFDVKSNAKKGEANIEYFWAANKNNGYASNYYSGHLTLSPTVLGESESKHIIYGVSWVNWATEPNYAATPYENPEVTVKKAPAAWTPVNSVASFDATWDVIGSSNMVAKATNIAGGDLFDLNGDATFGAAWKAVHDGSNLYILLKYSDKNSVTDEGTMTFEIMAQPTSPVRHEPTFLAAADSTADKTLSGASEVVRYQNQSYARNVELGGGKALFKDGLVTEYAASVGRVKNAWQNFVVGNWGPNEAGLEALLDADHFWNKTDGVIRAVMVMSFDGALSYPEDPVNLAGSRKAINVGDTFAFDVKSNAKKGEANVEYFWAADKNNGYASNYYSGHLTLSAEELEIETPQSDHIIYGVSWVNWATEPNYTATPYDNPKVNVYRAPSAWTPANSVASFDATWDILGDAHKVAHPTNITGGDLFDLNGDATFGASWKAVHDGQNFYVLLKYLDKNSVTDAGTMTFEIMAQPTSPVRHEPTFLAAADSTADKTLSGASEVIRYQNQSYARNVELGGGKALFKDGLVTEYAASVGRVKNAWQNFVVGNWGPNEAGLEALLDADHFWNKTDGIIRAVMVMSFNGALSYPEDPANLTGPRKAIKVGETFAFDVKSNAKKGDANIEYFWAADKNNGYASNYYSGHLTLVNIVTNVPMISKMDDPRVYISRGNLYVNSAEPVTLEVYNLLGVRMKSAQNVRQISVQDMMNGVYLVRINGEREATKVVKY
jgi:hypothetical protein